MTQKLNFSTSMTDWVGLDEAGRLIGMSLRNIYRLSNRGQLTIRVRLGQLLCYRPELETLAAAKSVATGKSELEKEVSLSPELQTKLLSIRNRLKKSSDDAICSLQGSGAPILQVMRVVDGKLSSPVSIPLS